MEDWAFVVELLASYDDNCKEVERLARHEILAIEVPVFSGLCNIRPFNILTALRRMDYWFGKIPTIEHSLCLVILTDYISCAYNQRNFYRTFEKALTQKFVDSLFEKLYDEWSKVFSGRPLICFTDSEFESIRKSLSRSVDRFPQSFRHKFLLNNVVQFCERYGKMILNANLQNVSDNLPKKQLSQVSSEKLLWKDKYKEDSSDSVNSWLKKKKTADMTKYIVKTPVREISTNRDVHLLSKETVNDFSVANYTDEKMQVSPKTSIIIDDCTDDSMESVDTGLKKKKINSSVAYYSDENVASCSEIISKPSPTESFFEMMDKLMESKSDVSDSDEKKMKVNCDSKSETDEENMYVKCDSNSDTCEEKINVANNNCNTTSETAVDKKVISICDCYDIKEDHASIINVPILSAPKKKLNAFDILMRKVIPPKRKRFF